MILDKVILLFGRPYTIVLIENIEKIFKYKFKRFKGNFT